MKKINRFLSCLGSFLFAGFLGIVGSKANAFKIVFIGDTGVGKTSIIERYVDDQFDKNINPTVGADFYKVSVTDFGEEVWLNLYDTAGQERFRSLIPAYFRNSNAAVLVSDMTEPTSLTPKSIGGHIGLYNSSCPNSPIFLVANKSDLVDENIRRSIISDFEQKYQKSGQVVGVFYTSALTGQGIDELFTYVAQYLSRNCDLNSASQTKGRHTHALQITDEIDTTAKKKACCKS